jgi:hypothetical protein
MANIGGKVDFPLVQDQVRTLLKDAAVVGFNINDDLRVLVTTPCLQKGKWTSRGT